MTTSALNNATLVAAPPAPNRWLLVVTIMLVAILEVLDSTIVNVSLPAMMASLGANTEQITWVLTSYIVASAIMLPLTGFLSAYFGRKQLLLINVAGFLVTSMVCGMSTSLGMMVIFRVFQGAFGATLMPLSQALLRDLFPKEQLGKAMAIWGLGIMAAPVLGPSIGGFITEHSTWRWVFYINVPICIVGFLLTYFVIPPTQGQPAKVDWFGLFLMIVGVGALQIFLDQGNQYDWLNSHWILSLLVISVLTIGLFFMHSLTTAHPLINFKIYKDRNFTLSTIILAFFCGSLFSVLALQPILQGSLFQYTAIMTGWVMAPRGIAAAVGMILAIPAMRKINVKYLLISALLMCAYGTYQLSQISLEANSTPLILSGIIQGLGMGLLMVPLTTYSLLTLPPTHITEASGLYSYGRMLGTSIGVSLLTTYVTRMTQNNWNRLDSHLATTNPNLQYWLQSHHLVLSNPTTPAILANSLYQQSNLLAYITAFHMLAYVFLLLIPLVLCMKSVDLSTMPGPPMGH